MLIDLVQITTRDGVQLHGTFQSPANTGSGGLPLAALCLVHGTGGSFYTSALFDRLTMHFLEKGVGVLRINTRGHDLMSNAVTAKGGLRLGAAYEVVDDCRHDLAGWLTWLQERVGPRIGLLGHSLGAVKCLYALAREPQLPARCVVALSPPRLSYSWFRSSPEGTQFLETYSLAEAHVQEGQSAALLDVKLPLPFVVAAGGYVEKYGPDERYNFLRFLTDVPCPALVTLGSVEVASSMAFRALPEAIAALGIPRDRLTVRTIAGADHVYTTGRDELLASVESWLPAMVS